MTTRMGKHDIESALEYLRASGIEVHAAPEPEVPKFDVTLHQGLYGHPERMSKHDLWMFVRGMRVARRIDAERRSRFARKVAK